MATSIAPVDRPQRATVRTVYDVQRDLDIDDLLSDAVPPPTCEWKRQTDPVPCGAPATWIMSLSCGHSTYLDDEHYHAAVDGFRGSSRFACSNPNPPIHKPMIFVDVRFDRISR
jgi:hypothetical protein